MLHFRITSRSTGRLTPRVRDGVADLLPHHLRDADVRTGARSRALALAARLRRRRRRPAATSSAPSSPTRPPRGRAKPSARSPTRPGEVIARQEWEHRAGWAGAYRELVGHTDEPTRSAPPPAGPGRARALFRAAHDALDLPDVGAEEADMTEGRSAPGSPPTNANAPGHPATSPTSSTPPTTPSAATADATVWAARADAPTPPPRTPSSCAPTPRTARAGGRAARRADRRTSSTPTHARAAWYVEHRGHPRQRRPRPRRARASAASTSTTPPTRSPPRNGSPHRADQAARELDQPIGEHDIDDTLDQAAAADKDLGDAAPGRLPDEPVADDPPTVEQTADDRSTLGDEPAPVDRDKVEVGVDVEQAADDDVSLGYELDAVAADVRDGDAAEVTESGDLTERRPADTVDETTAEAPTEQANRERASLDGEQTDERSATPTGEHLGDEAPGRPADPTEVADTSKVEPGADDGVVTDAPEVDAAADVREASTREVTEAAATPERDQAVDGDAVPDDEPAPVERDVVEDEPAADDDVARKDEPEVEVEVEVEVAVEVADVRDVDAPDGAETAASPEREQAADDGSVPRERAGAGRARRGRGRAARRRRRGPCGRACTGRRRIR